MGTLFPFLRRAYLARYLRFNATRKGLLGGSKGWLAVFAALTIGRQIGKVTKRGEAPIVYSERLEPGQVLVLTHEPPPPTRRQRRRGADPS